jgi:hypothetical protein
VVFCASRLVRRVTITFSFFFGFCLLDEKMREKSAFSLLSVTLHACVRGNGSKKNKEEEGKKERKEFRSFPFFSFDSKLFLTKQHFLARTFALTRPTAETSHTLFSHDRPQQFFQQQQEQTKKKKGFRLARFPFTQKKKPPQKKKERDKKKE